MMKLKRCPCGKTPTTLILNYSGQTKWATARGDLSLARYLRLLFKGEIIISEDKFSVIEAKLDMLLRRAN